MRLQITPRKLTWHLKIESRKRRVVFETIIFRFHVCFPMFCWGVHFARFPSTTGSFQNLGAFILTFFAKPSENRQTKKHLLYPPGRGFRKHSSIIILNHQCSLKDEIGQGWTDSFRVSPWWLWWMFDSLYCGGGYSTDVFFSWLFQGKWSNFWNIFLSNLSKPSTRPHDSIWCDMIPPFFIF